MSKLLQSASWAHLIPCPSCPLLPFAQATFAVFCASKKHTRNYLAFCTSKKYSVFCVSKKHPRIFHELYSLLHQQHISKNSTSMLITPKIIDVYSLNTSCALIDSFFLLTQKTMHVVCTIYQYSFTIDPLNAYRI